MTASAPRFLFPRLFLACGLTMLLLLAGGPLGAGPTTAADRPVFVVATEYWPPFRIEQRSGRPGGIDPALMARVGELMGVDFVFRRMPWARCLESLREGRADAVTGLAYTDERAAFIAYVEPSYLSCAPRFFTRKGHGGEVQKYEDLRGYVIAYSRNSAYFEPFDSDATLQKLAVTDESQIIELARTGRAPLFVGTDCQVEYDLKRLGLEGLFEQTAYKPEGRIRLFIGVSRRSPLMERMAGLEKALQEVVRQKVPASLAVHYGLTQ